MQGDERVLPSGELEGIYARLAGNSPDWGALGTLAALYECAGAPETVEALQWMASRRKRPYRDPNSSAFAWFNAAKVPLSLGDEESNVPQAIYSRLTRGNQVANHRSYRTLREAEEDFFTAWAAARAAGWSPEHEELVQSGPPAPDQQPAAEAIDLAKVGWEDLWTTVGLVIALVLASSLLLLLVRSFR